MAFTFKKNIFAAVAAVALAFGASSAHAASSPTDFTVNPASVGGVTFTSGQPPIPSSAPFVAQAITGNSSELLHPTMTGHKADGYIRYGYFNQGAEQVTMFGGQIYVLFHLEDHAINATENVLDVLTFSMYSDIDNNDVFTQSSSVDADLNGVPDGLVGTEASVSNTGGDRLLGSGSLVAGIATLNGLGGAALNGNTTFTLTPDGKNFFTAPVPFFSLSFNGFNNQTGGAVVNADGTIAINAGGQTAFNNPIPEPTSIALLGLGLLGVGATARRRKAA